MGGGTTTQTTESKLLYYIAARFKIKNKIKRERFTRAHD
jgi:hypothetical protein